MIKSMDVLKMPLKLSEAVYGNLLEKNYNKALSLGNRYSFINSNIFPLLNKEEQDLFMGFQDVCKKLLKEVNVDDAYEILPKLGEHYMLQRMNTYDGVVGSCKRQLLLNMAVNGMAPEVDMAMTASSILVGNSLYHNPDRNDIQEKALKEIYRGTKVGGIGITEPEHGSDAVNMKTTAKIAENGDITYNGTKIYTTNGAVADYFSTYGVTDISNPRRTMMLTLFKRDDPGLSTERLHIPAAHGVGIAKVNYDNITVTKDRMIAPPGEGYKRLFRGLTPERFAITTGTLGGVWHALATGTIYTQLRHQFGKPLFKYQGISHVLSDTYSELSAYTAFAMQIADFYDKKVGEKIHRGETPNAMDEATVAILAAQGKYLTTRMSHRATYEIVQLMGGRGAIDEPGSNNIINRGENISRLMEVLGGHRNIQRMIIEMGLKASTSMAIGSNIKKAKREQGKVEQNITQLVMARAEKMLSEEAQFLPDDEKANLSNAVNKLKAAVETNNKIEMAAYARVLPKVLSKAGKAVYKAKKAQ
ncbi:Crotonobetainyl-CoA reductase [Candidatus Lokiarchaeum ossiferum]|uniref:Crotonobetainyl-CoA reductase n=1 Tax=Candidatus Lokiarchaeum ossiferum TaxID=2951803 RepID=A0ABY6HN16_9ARCH|nr:Crotonobetainyl-CoA reductase [Candidatus Lokiarchaeum sp. B-35]